MAYMDYFHCTVCAAKTFYDAKLHYPRRGDWDFVATGLPGGAGAMAVLCRDCAPKHEITITLKGGQ